MSDHFTPPPRGSLWDSGCESEDSRFDRENPGVYTAFVAEAVALKNAGVKHYSARTIVHVLRHHSAVRGGDPAFKINDHISPYMARRLMRERPEFRGWFELRERKNEEGRAA